MGISGITGFSGFGNYRISSIHDNPYSMNPVQRVEYNSRQSGKPLVIASEDQQDDLYVKDYGSLEAPKSTATGDFAEMLSIQESMLSQENDSQENGQDSYASYLKDTIGVMGFQNGLRDKLNSSMYM